jgi:two-component system phosphate regulon response regulator PhoB
MEELVMSTNKRILLVDDDSSLRAILRGCLEMAGYTCIEAKDGQDARGKLENKSPHLIVTDHEMPRVTGLELIKGLKSQKNTEAIPIILYSGQLTADLKTHALQAGAIAVLEKPFPLQEFLDLVAQVCEETR